MTRGYSLHWHRRWQGYDGYTRRPGAWRKTPPKCERRRQPMEWRTRRLVQTNRLHRVWIDRLLEPEATDHFNSSAWRSNGTGVKPDSRARSPKTEKR